MLRQLSSLKRVAAMQGVHAFDPDAQMTIRLESFVSKDHFLRRVDRLLDFSLVRELTSKHYANGKRRPSIDPEVFFRMLLDGHLFGISSERRLCAELRYKLAYR